MSSDAITNPNPATRDQRQGGPIVSVVIPAYRTAQYISEALDSVFAQTFKDYEVIVVNDGCPETPALESALTPYMDRIIYLKQQNRGPAAARNTGIKRAKGTYVAFLDSDDIWSPEYLAEQIEAFSADPSLDVHYVDARLFGKSPLNEKTHMQIWPSSGPVTLSSLLSIKVAPVNVCTVVRRKALLAVGLFDEHFTRAEDLHLYARLAHAGYKFGYSNHVLARVRLREESLTADCIALFKGQLDVYRSLARIPGLNPVELELLDDQLRRAEADLSLESGKTYLKNGDYAAASSALTKAQAYYHSRKLSAVLMALRSAPGLVKYAYGLRDRIWNSARGNKVSTA